MIRLFAAITPPAEAVTALATAQKGLPGARWRPPDSLHLTLRFFGSVNEATADDLDSALASVRGRPFRVAPAGVGVFDEADHAHAVWAGVATNEPLRLLAGRCERSARRAGLAAERRLFRPHITLAYLHRASPTDVVAWLQRNGRFQAAPFDVSRFGLFSSWPGRGGSIYRLERAYPLS